MSLAGLVLTVFGAAVLLNLVIPRFYCRFICPLGAFLGIISRFAIWRIGKTKSECINCKFAKSPAKAAVSRAAISKSPNVSFVLTVAMIANTTSSLISPFPSLAGEVPADISRRGFVLSLASGVFAAPAIRLSGRVASNWYSQVIRPPGALAEQEFLKRCIKCGQCMRVCPTNVIQPAGVEGGLEGLWTPVLNNRIGSSGCQLNCVACGQVCPTSAIRPITLDEKKGLGEFADKGPVKLGTAFVDRNRCLPWSMDKPCIVCQENCPVSPKAIYTQDVFATVRDGAATVKKATNNTIEIDQRIPAGKFGTGDYYVLFEDGNRCKIASNTDTSIEISEGKLPAAAGKIEIQVRLQRPCVDIENASAAASANTSAPSAEKGL